MTIRVTIEQLLIDGIAVDHRHAAELQRAVQARLARLLGRTTPEAAAEWPDRDRVAVTDARVTAGDNPARFGAQIADAIHQGLIQAQEPRAPLGAGAAGPRPGRRQRP